MLKDFYVEKKKREKIIKEKRKEIQGVGKLYMWFNSLFKIITFLPIVWAFLEIMSQEEIDYVMALILLAMGGMIAGILGIISLLISKVVKIKLLGFWTSNQNMELHLCKGGVEYGTCVEGIGEEFRTYYFEYEDIINLEFDRKNHLFCIYGTYVNKTWNNVSRTKLVHESKKTTDVGRITFLDYFQNFEVFLEQIQEETGLCVKNVEIKMQQEGGKKCPV